MAKRKTFVVSLNDIFEEKEIEFVFYSGFSITQKQKSIESLHNAIKELYYDAEILEISSKSPIELGRKLSAFNLKLDGIALENIFQSSKVFEYGGPYEDLLSKTPIEAKKDPRIKDSGRIIGFKYQGINYPTIPKTLFYDWMYCQALYSDKELMSSIINYDFFTDIEFNHEKSLNCQARSAAIFVSLYQKGLLEECLSDIVKFEECVYKPENKQEQLFLF